MPTDTIVWSDGIGKWYY